MPAKKLVVRQVGEMEDLVEQILIRIPPDEPGDLLRASLVCKPWRDLIASEVFRGRYEDFHRAPHMLGFLHNWPRNYAEFVPTADFRPRGPDHKDQFSVSVEDCRHGRVLLSYLDEDDNQMLAVWDPMTGGQIVLRCPGEMSGTIRWRASVLCAAAPGSCSHSHGGCHSGPFLVVFVTIDEEELVAAAYTYSSATSSWSSPALTEVDPFLDKIRFSGSPSVLAGDALYLLLWRHPAAFGIEDSILKYDLGNACLSEILLSEHEGERVSDSPILMVDEAGRVGIAHLFYYGLYVWWRKVVHGVETWTRQRDIHLKTDLFPPGDFWTTLELVGSVEGTGIIFAVSIHGTYMLDVKSQSAKMLSTKLYQHPNVRLAVFPYITFYYPPAPAYDVVSEASSEAGHGNAEA